MEDEPPGRRARVLSATPGFELVAGIRTRIALHTVVGEVEGEIITADGEPFDTSAYSRFKYGHTEQADRYGESLAKLLLEHPISGLYVNSAPLVVTASAYKRLATAAQLVANSVAKRLGWAHFMVHAGRIHRARLTEGDYGTMAHEERQYWMANNGLSVDTELFAGRHVVVVDDVRITGSHEESIWQLFADMPIESLTNLYVVTLDPKLAKRDPKIEDRMNHAEIRTLRDLYGLIWSGSYCPTARTVKFVLSQPADTLKIFLREIDGGDLRAIHMGLIDDGYDKMDTYSVGSRLVLKEVARRKRAASRRRYEGFEDPFWRTWNPVPYDGPTNA